MRAPSPFPIRAWEGFHILKGNLSPYGEAPYPPLLAAKDAPVLAYFPPLHQRPLILPTISEKSLAAIG